MAHWECRICSECGFGAWLCNYHPEQEFICPSCNSRTLPVEQEYDYVLDELPEREQGMALMDLVDSGDVRLVFLPFGFIGVKVVQKDLYVPRRQSTDSPVGV